MLFGTLASPPMFLIAASAILRATLPLFSEKNARKSQILDILSLTCPPFADKCVHSARLNLPSCKARQGHYNRYQN